MNLIFASLFALVALPQVFAHTYLSSLVINGDALAEGTCVRAHPSTAYDSPIPLVTQADMTCGWLPEAARPTAKKCTTAAGSTVGLQWYHTSPSASDDIIATSHLGPVIVYLAKSETGSGNVWFKIYEDGFDPKTLQWGVSKLIANRGLVNVKLPSDITPGNYLIRGEVLALHGANALLGVQPYVGCGELTITGGGSSNPAGVAIPGVYSQTDPGMFFNLYGAFTTYPVPGPAVYTSKSSSSSTAAPPPPAAATKTPTNAPVTTQAPAATTTKAPVSTKAPATTKAPVSSSTKAPAATTTQAFSNAPATAIRIQLYPSSSQWWIALTVRSTPTVSAISFKDSGAYKSAWVPMQTTNWGYFIYGAVNGQSFVLPLSVQITGTDGTVAELNEFYTEWTQTSFIDTNVQFSNGKAPREDEIKPMLVELESEAPVDESAEKTYDDVYDEKVAQGEEEESSEAQDSELEEGSYEDESSYEESEALEEKEGSASQYSEEAIEEQYEQEPDPFVEELEQEEGVQQETEEEIDAEQEQELAQNGEEEQALPQEESQPEETQTEESLTEEKLDGQADEAQSEQQQDYQSQQQASQYHHFHHHKHPQQHQPASQETRPAEVQAQEAGEFQEAAIVQEDAVQEEAPAEEVVQEEPQEEQQTQQHGYHHKQHRPQQQQDEAQAQEEAPLPEAETQETEQPQHGYHHKQHRPHQQEETQAEEQTQEEEAQPQDDAQAEQTQQHGYHHKQHRPQQQQQEEAPVEEAQVEESAPEEAQAQEEVQEEVKLEPFLDEDSSEKRTDPESTEAASEPQNVAASPIYVGGVSAPTVAPSSSIKVMMHEGSSEWWLAVDISNLNTPVQYVELRDSSANGMWVGLGSTDWNYWTYATSGQPLVAPLAFRLTTKNGRSVTFLMNEITPNSMIDTGVQFL